MTRNNEDLLTTGNAEAVRNERLRRRLSMDTAASLAGMSHVTWRRIERGLPVRSQHLFSAMNFLGLTDASSQTSPTPTTSVVSDLAQASARAGRMRVLAGFGGAQ